MKETAARPKGGRLGGTAISARRGTNAVHGLLRRHRLCRSSFFHLLEILIDEELLGRVVGPSHPPVDRRQREVRLALIRIGLKRSQQFCFCILQTALPQSQLTHQVVSLRRLLEPVSPPFLTELRLRSEASGNRENPVIFPRKQRKDVRRWEIARYRLCTLRLRHLADLRRNARRRCPRLDRHWNCPTQPRVCNSRLHLCIDGCEVPHSPSTTTVWHQQARVVSARFTRASASLVLPRSNNSEIGSW